MTSSTLQLFLFGDQTENLFQHLLDLFKDAKHSRLLEDFFKSCASALIREISTLSVIEQNKFPRFSTLNELVEAHCQGNTYDPVISGVLLCLTQLGRFIRYAETTPHAYPSSNTVYIGLSVGLISAAAIASSKSLTHLLEIATDVVRICFRIGVEARRRAQQLERDADTESSWSMILSDVSSTEAKSSVEAFSQEQNIVPNKQAYISAESTSSVTISGPPSTLKLLFSKSKILANSKYTPVFTRGLYHAGHLGAVDTKSIIGSESRFSSYSVIGQIHSTRNGNCFSTTNLQDLLAQVVEDILLETLRWNHVVSELIARLTLVNCTRIDILSFESTNESNNLVDSLSKSGITACIKTIDESTSISYTNSCKGAIAIVGMGGRFPGGEDLDEFWKTLINGLDLHKTIPSDRFDVKTHCDPTGALRNSTWTPYGCFIDRPGLFDAGLFNMTPREATQTDPQQRLTLLATYEALEMAGYVPNRTPSTKSHRIGTFFGQTSDDWREINAAQDIDTYYIPGGIRAFGPGRLNYYFKWEGPSYSIDTACSSSAAAIQLAYSALVNKECDTAVVGGMNILTSPDPFAGLSRGNFLSKTGSCKTFDDSADGYCRADGIGCLVMKRLEDAIADNDNIQAMLMGAVTNHSAEAASITHPHEGTQKRLFRRLLNDTVLHPNDIDYIEMHGTGTQAGDGIEMQAVTKVFANNRDPKIPLYIGSIKANIGHGEAASGVTSIIKAIMMLQNSTIPPHVGIKNRLNSKFPSLDALNVRIVKYATDFKPRTSKSKRRIIVNNFDAAGGNTSILIEDPPVRVVERVDPRTFHVVTISAKNPFSFKANVERLLAYIKKYPESSIGDISYTTTARRMHHRFRQAYAVSSVTELASSLEKLVATTNVPVKTLPVNVALVFTGQGSHYLKMGKELFDNCSAFRKDILEYDNICQRQGLPSFKALIEGSAESLELLSSIHVQLALIALELALANMYLSLGIKPTLVIGHSLGEYAALCIAGVLSVSDTLFLVGKRASLINAKCNPGTYTMLSVMVDAESVKQDLVKHATSCEIACFNGPKCTVISGRIPDVDSLKTFYKSKGIKTLELDVPVAFHSSQLDPILEDFRIVAESASFSKPVIPVASTLLGSIVKEKDIFTASYLCRQAREPVKFSETLEQCKATGIIDERTLWLEIGPNPVCLSMVKSILNVPVHLAVQTLKKEESNLASIAACVAKIYNAGGYINWMEYQREYESAHRLLTLPTYAFELKNYWLQYEGDWCLRKNIPSSSQLIQIPTSNFCGTTSLQRIEREKFDSSGASVVFVSDFSDPKLRNTVQGHVVNSVGLCPCAVFTDMAFTAAKYIHKRCNQSTPCPSMDVMDMEANETLTQSTQTDEVKKQQLVYLSATHKVGSDTVELTFVSEEGSTKKTIATCKVQYGDGTKWMAGWKKHAYLIQSRMNDLVKAADSGKSHRLLRDMAYKLFSVLVQYADKYRGIEEVWMDSNMLEATANVKFQTTAEDGSFECSPFWIDGIVHLSGFVLNSAGTRSPNFLYTSNGWQSLRIVGDLSAEKSYKSYVCMQPINNKNTMSGDVYLFEEGKIIAVCEGIKFHLISRSVLDYLLPSPDDKASVRKSQPVRNDKAASRVDGTSISTADSNGLTFDEVLKAIVIETGVKMEELHDEVNLIDLGVDSLLTIAILARLHRLTNMDIPTSLFQTHPRIGDLRKLFTANGFAEFTDGSSHSSDSEYSVSSVTSKNSGISSSSSDLDMVDTIRSIIAAEIGCEEAQIRPSTILSDLGVDDLRSLSIANIIRSKTGINVSATIFQDRITFSNVFEKLGITSKVTTIDSFSRQSEVVTVPRLSTSVFLQGTPTNLPPLFLLPDGSGSASSYVPLPVFDSGLVVYGLNSPFLECPTKFTCTVEEVVGIYVTEIKRRQPTGPYILGGWSAGGIWAYEAATQLIASGEKVLGLIFIDSPCPITLPPFPFEYIDFLDSIGIFDTIHKGSSYIPALIKQHFMSCITVVRQYKPKPIDPVKAPKAVAIWAKEGVLESTPHKHVRIPIDDRPDNLKNWLLAERTDYGPAGWEILLPSVECTVIPGNHFTIMRQPHVINLAKEIEQAALKLMKLG